MLDLSKAFPERVRIATEAIANQKKVMKTLDPFGGALDDAALDKTIHHHFENGHRVVVNSPGHHTHGHAGVITDDRNDNRLEVKLDSGHTVHCHEGDLVPEGFEPAAVATDKIAKGELQNPIPIDDSVALAKRARFRTGDRVVEKLSGRTGTVINVSDAGLVEIRLGPGHTALCPAGGIEPAA